MRIGSTNNPVAQNFPSFQPTALYAQSGSVGAFGLSWWPGEGSGYIRAGGKQPPLYTLLLPSKTDFFRRDKRSFLFIPPIGVLRVK